MEPTAPDRPRPRFRVLSGLFPAAVFAAATFFLLGDLGKWADEWYYLQRDPATGEIQGLYLQKPIHVFRPLFRATISTLQTLLWRDEWANHLISAAAHGLAALLLWRLLLSMGFTRLASGVGAMFFALYPVHFEVVLWPGALPTTLGLSVALAGLMLGLRHARGRAGWWAIPGVGAIAFVSASFNEQPALILAALPLLALATCPDGAPARRVFLRASASAAAAGVALAAYVVIHQSLNLRKPAIGHDAMFVPPDEMWRALKMLLYWGRGRHLLHDFSRPAMAEGLVAIRAHPVAAIAFGALILAGAAPWVARHVEKGDERPQPPARDPPRVLPTLADAAAIFVVAWAPVVVFHYWLMPRMAYAPTTAIAMLVALALDVGARHTARRPGLAARWRFAAAVAWAAASIYFALILIGAQSMFQQRSRRDLAEVAALRAMVPDPEPGSVFAPMRIAPPPPRPRARAFDPWFMSALNTWWSARWIIRFEYRRSDLDSGSCMWDESGFIAIDDSGVVVRGVGPVSWDRLIPFEIDPRSRVRLVARVVVEGADGRRQQFAVPQVLRLDPDAIVRAGFEPPGVFVRPAP